MVTLGYRDPETGRESVVEVGPHSEELGGHWAIEIDPETREGIGSVFFAPDSDLF
jgi:hypothetical protein